MGGVSVLQMGEISNAYKILVRESKGRDPLGDLDTGTRPI
jgi:hypothetical protein